jgi:hypothetical protein
MPPLPARGGVAALVVQRWVPGHTTPVEDPRVAVLFDLEVPRTRTLYQYKCMCTSGTSRVAGVRVWWVACVHSSCHTNWLPCIQHFTKPLGIRVRTLLYVLVRS